MKKSVLLWILAMLLCIFPACTNEPKPNVEANNAATEIRYDSIDAPSLNEFNAKFNTISTNATSTQKILQIVNNKQLDFEEYDFRILCYERKKTDGGNYSGAEWVDLYWHEQNCPSCQEGLACRGSFTLHISYSPEGYNASGITIGYTQADNSDFYVKEINNNKVSYIFLWDTQYYFRFSIGKEVENRSEIIDQLNAFAQEVKSILNENVSQ